MDINTFILETEKEYRKNNCEICVDFDDPETCGDRHLLSTEKQEDWEWIKSKLHEVIFLIYEDTLEILDRSINKSDAGIEIIGKVKALEKVDKED